MILIIDMSDSSPLARDEFVLPIVGIARKFDECAVRHYTELDEESLKSCDRVILSGSTLKGEVRSDELDNFKWLRSFDKPVLGICAGMQVVSISFGSEMIGCEEIGMTLIRTVRDNQLFVGGFEAYGLHRYSVNPSGEMDVLAESDNCIEAVKVKDKNIFGVLFHPEARNKDIIERFCSLGKKIKQE